MISNKERCTIEDNLPGLIECAMNPRDAVQVRTSMLYPDGGIVDVFVTKASEGYIVTDFGDTIGWLFMQSAGGKLSPTQRSLLDDTLLAQSVQMDNGELQIHCGDLGSLGEAVQRVAQTVVLISDLHSEKSLHGRGALEGRPC